MSRIWFWTLILTLNYLSLVSSTAAANGKKNPYGAKATRLECEFNEKYCANTTCILKPLSRSAGRIDVGCDLIQPQKAIRLKVEVFTKSSSNIYYPGSFRFEDDFCAIGNGSKEAIITKHFASAFSRVRSYFQPCPIVGRHRMENFRFDNETLPSNILPSGEHRLDGQEFNGRKEKIMLYQIYFTVKNQFF